MELASRAGSEWCRRGLALACLAVLGAGPLLLVYGGQPPNAAGTFAAPAASPPIQWVGGSGDWNDANHWSTGTMPGTSDEVVIAPTQSNVTVTHSTGTHTVKGLKIQTAFVLSGGQLAASTIQLSAAFTLSGGTIQGGTVQASGDGKLILTQAGGTLDGVTLNTSVDATGEGANATVLNGLVLNGTATIGGPGGGCYLDFKGTQTLSGTGTVVFGAGRIIGMRLLDAKTTLTIGPGITIRGGALNWEYGAATVGYMWPTGTEDVSVVNQGQIIADTSKGLINVIAQAVINEGTLQASNGGNLNVTDLTTNSGSVLVNGGTLTLGGPWQNTGLIELNTGTLKLGGTFKLAALGKFQREGGTLNLTGTLDNQNTTLVLEAAMGSWQLAGGTILGGVIQGSNVGQLVFTDAGGVLNGVTLNTDVDMTSNAGRATVVNGLVLNGTARIGGPGGNCYWEFKGTQTLSGNGTVILGSAYLLGIRLVEAKSVLTIGPGITVRGGNTNGSYGGATIGYSVGGETAVSIINQGQIIADTPAGLISVWCESLVNQGTLKAAEGATLSVQQFTSSSGTISADGGTVTLIGPWQNTGLIEQRGGVLNFGGTFKLAAVGKLQRNGGTLNVTGTLDNRGTTLELGGTIGGWQLAGGTIQGGTIQTSDDSHLGSTLNGGVLDGVTVNGDLDVTTDGAHATVMNGLVLNGTARIGGPGGNCYLDFKGTQTLGGNGTVVFGSAYLLGIRVVESKTVLTIGPGITVRGGNANWNYGGATVGAWISTPDVSLINQGRIIADTPKGLITLDGQSLINQGTIRVLQGATLAVGRDLQNLGVLDAQEGTCDFSASLRVDDPGVLRGQLLANIVVHGDLLGTTVDTSPSKPTVSLAFSPPRQSSGQAQLLEVASKDLGPDPAGFKQNFAYGSLSLTDKAQVRLADLSTNSSGSGAEALYVHWLTVLAGTALDLNGLHLYTRSVQGGGGVTNGTIQQVADGGPIEFGVATPGAISKPGEVDEWTFFGRAGQSYTVVVNPGTAGWAAPFSPQLNTVETSLLNAGGDVLAHGTNAIPGAVLTLNAGPVSSDGVLRLQVRAAPLHPESAGNYSITLWNATLSLAPLLLNQTTVGYLHGPYEVDGWTFGAVAQEQIRLKVLNASTISPLFDLLGPGGWIGFSNVVTGPGLITLPASGTYTLSAHGSGTHFESSYAFRVEQTAQTDLVLGTSFKGTLAAQDQAQLYRLNLSANSPLRVTWNDESPDAQNEVYLKFGAPPTRGDYDYRSSSKGPDGQVLVSMATPGVWYVLVYAAARSQPSEYQVLAETAPVFVQSITPHRQASGSAVTLAIAGAGYDSSVKVSLVAAGGQTYTASPVQVDSFVHLTAQFQSASPPEGQYAVRVTAAAGASEIPDAVELVTGGYADVQASVIVPSAVSVHAPATLYLTYTNMGSFGPAPLLSLTPVQQGGAGALLSLDPARVTTGYYSPWSNSPPEGFATTVQILASGKTPGILEAGESGRVPVYWAGCLMPFTLAAPIEFRLDTVQIDSPEPIDWPALSAKMRPINVSQEAWNVIFANFTNRVGGTWGGYVRMLNDDARYLDGLGQHVVDVGQLLDFEFYLANGLAPYAWLNGWVDVSVKAPGFRLAFSRAFYRPISQRYRLGPLGRGWAHNWEISLYVRPDGPVRVRMPDGAERIFTPDSRGTAYFTGPGDTGTLAARAGGGFTLRERRGLLYAFRPDGKLDYVEDTNGNRVRCDYTGEQLAALTHSSGRALQLAYNAVGRLQYVTDPYGRTTTYTYDAANQHLTSVQDYDGKVTAYTYSSGQGPAREHALTQISYPGGAQYSLAYDARGRLIETSWNDGAERLRFDYSEVGTITVSNALGQVRKTFLGRRGLQAKFVDGLGHSRQSTYDDNYRRVAVTGATGRQTRYEYDAHGNLSRAIDALGHVRAYSYSTSFNRRSTVTDSKGQGTQLIRDPRGNLLSAIYPDGTRRSSLTSGQTTWWTNRSGQTVQFNYDVDGRLLSKLKSDGSRADYAYDAHGNLISASNYTGVIFLHYDPTDLLTRLDYPGGQSLEFTYDAARRRATSTDQLGYRLEYHYDLLGRLEGLSDPAGTALVRYTYDAAGRTLRKDLGNGVYTLFEYDAASRLVHSINAKSDGSILSRFEYGYDDEDRPIRLDTVLGRWTYSYDDLGQLTRAVFTATAPGLSNQDLQYSYDVLGNRILAVENGASTAYTVNNMNQYTEVGAVKYEFDPDGNMIRESGPQGVTSYVYDVENRLVQVSKGINTWQYAYDPFGRRVTTIANGVITDYVVDPVGFGNVVGEYDGTGKLLTRYDHGFGLIGKSRPGEGRFYYAFDPNANTSEITDPNALPVNRYAYLPFGTRQFLDEQTPNPFQFAGFFGVTHEATGLEFMRARFYDANLGRFLREDPLGLAGPDANPYRYVRNSPCGHVDPAGLDYQTTEECMNDAKYFYLLGRNSCNTEPDDESFLDCVKRHLDSYDKSIANCKNSWGDDDDKGDEGGSGGGGGGSDGCSGCGGGGGSGGGGGVGIGGPGPIAAGSPSPSSGIGDEAATRGFGLGAGDGPLVGGGGPGGAGGSVGSPGPVGGNGPTGPLAQALDPNEKLGPAGFGTSHFVAAGSTLPFRIDFENERTATAPAQWVRITDQLDSNLDWSTFEFTEVGFGDRLIQVTGNGTHFETVLPMTYRNLAFQVRISLDFSVSSGTVTANFMSINPATELPPDVLVGFLPPEDGTGRGQAHVSYLVRSKAALPTGTRLRNVALIQFDFGQVIGTNQVDPHDPAKGTDPQKEFLNTVDGLPPTSQVLSLPATTSSPEFTVSWFGLDDPGGSGVASYDIYVSGNSSGWGVWQNGVTQTSAPFTGLAGHTYAFYSVATDHVGLSQSANPRVDAQTTVVSSGSGLLSISYDLLEDAVTISWPTQLGSVYSLQSCPNLGDPWTVVEPFRDLPGTGAKMILVDRQLQSARFYRLLLSGSH